MERNRGHSENKTAGKEEKTGRIDNAPREISKRPDLRLTPPEAEIGSEEKISGAGRGGVSGQIQVWIAQDAGEYADGATVLIAKGNRAPTFGGMAIYNIITEPIEAAVLWKSTTRKKTAKT